MGIPGGRERRAQWVPAGLIAGLVLAGCTSSGSVSTEPPEPVAATSTPSATSAVTDETAAILAAHREFFDRQTEISIAPKDQRKELLAPFTTEPALQRVLGGMFAAEELGEVGYGVAVLNPRVTEIDGDRATVRDCQDNRNVGRKKIETGKIVTKGFKRDHAEVGLIRGGDGRWRVSTVEYLDEKC